MLYSPLLQTSQKVGVEVELFVVFIRRKFPLLGHLDLVANELEK